MSTPLVDARPPGVNAQFRPGNTFDLTLTWPTDELDGRSFTATLDAASLTVAVVADTMTVSASAAQTTTAGEGSHDFVLTETTGGIDQDVIVGRWVGSTQGTTSQSTTVEVTESAATVSVSVAAVHASGVSGNWSVGGDLTVTEGIITGAPVLTNHDRYWFHGRQFEGSAGLEPQTAQDAAPPSWAFDASTVERMKWVWVPGDGWEAYTKRMAWFNLGGGAGDVVWRYKAHPIVLAGSAVTAPSVVNTMAPVTAPAVLGTGWTYSEIATAVPIVLGPFDSAPLILSVIDRVATDAGDTLGNDAGVFAVSVTRVDS